MGFLFRSFVRGRLRPAACGLRATALRCSAERAPALWSWLHRYPSRSIDLSQALRRPLRGRPVRPVLLAATQIAKQQPPPAPLRRHLAGQGERQTRALAQASGTDIHGAPLDRTRSMPARPHARTHARPHARQRALVYAPAHAHARRKLACWPRVPGAHARLREHFNVFFPKAKRGASRAGRVGEPVSRFRRRRGAQVTRVARAAGRGGRAALCGRPKHRPATPRPSDEALVAEHRSAVARRPQAVADRRGMSETGAPTRPATRGLRAPAAIHHDTPSQRRIIRAPTALAGVDPATARRMTGGGGQRRRRPTSRDARSLSDGRLTHRA